MRTDIYLIWLISVEAISSTMTKVEIFRCGFFLTFDVENFSHLDRANSIKTNLWTLTYGQFMKFQTKSRHKSFPGICFEKTEFHCLLSVVILFSELY
jgi:hypothetical protein